MKFAILSKVATLSVAVILSLQVLGHTQAPTSESSFKSSYTQFQLLQAYIYTLSQEQLKNLVSSIETNATVPAWFNPGVNWDTSDLEMIMVLAQSLIIVIDPDKKEGTYEENGLDGSRTIQIIERKN